MTVPVPDFSTLTEAERAEMDPDPDVVAETVAGQLSQLQMHDLVDVDLTGLWDALRSSPVRLSTMGRKLPADAASFLAAAAAGRCAAGIAHS